MSTMGAKLKNGGVVSKDSRASAPGPGAYVAKSLDSKAGGYIGGKIKTGGIESKTSTNKYIGPGSYDISGSLVKKGNTKGTFGRPKEDAGVYDLDAVPGPGRYDQPSDGFVNPCYGFGSSIRPGLSRDGGKYPGPGQYFEIDFRNNRGFAMAGKPLTADPGARYRASMPAPNQYD